MYEAELRGAGMNPAQFELMSYLQARPGVGQAVLAEAMDVDQTTLSRNMKVLAGQGWVTVSAGVKDRRVSTYALRDAGEAALQAAMPLWERAKAKVAGSLGDEAAVWRVLGELGSAAERGVRTMDARE
jgi:DNA-binding MarR family transcriptional regulator